MAVSADKNDGSTRVGLATTETRKGREWVIRHVKTSKADNAGEGSAGDGFAGDDLASDDSAGEDPAGDKPAGNDNVDEFANGDVRGGGELMKRGQRAGSGGESLEKGGRTDTMRCRYTHAEVDRGYSRLITILRLDWSKLQGPMPPGMQRLELAG
jgi:hypothetical protein